MYSALATALSFLTIFRLPQPYGGRVSPQGLAESFSHFPLVGLTIGLGQSLLYALLHSHMPSLLLAVMLTAAMAVMTRGLHLDGLADLADGIGGGYTPERRLEIMKDSRTGAFGAVALILVLFFKVAALDALMTAQDWTPLLVVPMLSRFVMVLSAYKSPYARKESGLGKPFLAHMHSRHRTIASLEAAILLLMLTPRTAPLFLMTALGLSLLTRRLAGRWLGGITGDVLGAANEISEAALLTLAASMA